MAPSDAWLELVICDANDYGHVITMKPSAVGRPCWTQLVWVVLCLYCLISRISNTAVGLPELPAPWDLFLPSPCLRLVPHSVYHTKLIFCTGLHCLPSFHLTSPDLANAISSATGYLILCDDVFTSWANMPFFFLFVCLFIFSEFGILSIARLRSSLALFLLWPFCLYPVGLVSGLPSSSSLASPPPYC